MKLGKNRMNPEIRSRLACRRDHSNEKGFTGNKRPEFLDRINMIKKIKKIFAKSALEVLPSVERE